MRSKTDPTITQQISERFVELIETHLSINWSEAERILGYKNRTTLDAIRKGKVLPGPDKLFLIARYVTDEGKSPNIDWLFSNRGLPLLIADNGEENITLSQTKKNSGNTLNAECQIAVLSLVDLVQRTRKHSKM